MCTAGAAGKRGDYNRATASPQDPAMNDETFNLSIRKFLKMVGVSSQREIEQAVARGIADGRLKGSETIPATMTLRVAGLDVEVRFDGEVKLE